MNIPAEALNKKLDRGSRPGVSRKKERRAIEAARRNGIMLWHWRTALEDYKPKQRKIIKMKQSFLDSLAGLLVDSARETAEAAGHEVQIVPMGVALSAVARPNTVVLWVEDNIVKFAKPGDPLELVK